MCSSPNNCNPVRWILVLHQSALIFSLVQTRTPPRRACLAHPGTCHRPIGWFPGQKWATSVRFRCDSGLSTSRLLNLVRVASGLLVNHWEPLTSVFETAFLLPFARFRGYACEGGVMGKAPLRSLRSDPA